MIEIGKSIKFEALHGIGWAKYIMRNAESGISYNIAEYHMRKKLTEFGIFWNVTKVVVCYLLNKRLATFTIVPYTENR